MKRSRLRRGPWRRKKNRPPRPGLTEKPRAGAAWKRICLQIQRRDGNICRRCGHNVLGDVHPGHVDHLVPRRLCATAALADQPDNLGLLCNTCHAHKTQVLEPELYRGDVGAFRQFLASIESPQPPVDMIAYAYSRIAQEMRG